MNAREPIFAALFAQLAAVPGFVSTSRRLKHWSDVPISAQPALFQIQRGEEIAQHPGLPGSHRLSADLYLYAATGHDRGVAPAQILNPLIDAVEAALAPDAATGLQTLGGLVQHAWIEGRIETDEGVLGDQAVAIIPVELLVA